MNDVGWEQLLGQIHDGLVVPVLGSQLLVDPGTGRSLLQRVAERMEQRYELDHNAGASPTGLELSGVINRLKRDSRIRLQDLYEKVYEAIHALTLDETSIPMPICQLAQIADFRLMVTVTPDDMLARCLRKRCAVREIIHSPNLSLAGVANDLPGDWQERAGEVHLLYLFGKSQRTPVFAIHEEDVLEYAHNMIARGSNVPKSFLGELQERNLLFIGCRFPDWLSRFFLRVTNKERLSRERSKREWLIEQLTPEESLTVFVKSYSKDTEILSEMEPAAFIAELHRRWMAEHGAEAEKPAASNHHNGSPLGAMFFVSYSRHTDLARAEAIVQALLKLGVSKEEVWFDRTNIEPGQDFVQRIFDGIKSCRYFMPLLSTSANEREEAFVFSEWRKANERFSIMNREFVVPVVVDADYSLERYTSQAPDWPVRVWKDRLDIGHAPEGMPDGRMTTKLRELIREARREGRPS